MTQVTWNELIRPHTVEQIMEAKETTRNFLDPRSLASFYEYSKDDNSMFIGSDIRQLVGEIQRLRERLSKYDDVTKKAEMTVGDLLEASVQIALNREIRKLADGEATPICPELAALKGYLDNSDVVYIQSRVDAGTNCIMAERLSALRQAVDFTLQHEMQTAPVPQ